MHRRDTSNDVMKEEPPVKLARISGTVLPQEVGDTASAIREFNTFWMLLESAIVVKSFFADSKIVL